MIRAALIAVVLAGCAKERGAVVGTGDDPVSVIAGELLHVELAARPEGARRVRCGETIDCLARLRSGAVDVMVVERDELSWLVGDGEVEVIAELPVERRFALAGAGAIRATVDLAALDRPPKIAVSPRFAARARGGLAELSARLRIEPEPLSIADPGDRATLLAAGLVDAAVFETWRRPAETAELATVGGSRYVVVARPGALAHSRDAIARATGAVVVRLEKLGDRLLAAVGAGLDPIDAVERIAPRQRQPDPPLVLAASPRHGSWSPLIERSLAARTVVTAESPNPAGAIAANTATLALIDPGASVDGAELIAVFEGRGRPAAELWGKTGALELADARRVLAATGFARLPGDQRPSLWRRHTASATAPPPRGASRWFDTLINLLTGTFLIWLLISIVRRDQSRA